MKAILFLLACCATAQVPRFEDYPVPTVFRGKPAPPRRQLAFQAFPPTEVDFAGHYSVVTWPCGTECMALAVIDAKTGKVYYPPFNSPRWPFMVPISAAEFEYPEYRVNSRLFILKNACPNHVNKGCKTYYFDFGPSGFKRILR